MNLKQTLALKFLLIWLFFLISSRERETTLTRGVEGWRGHDDDDEVAVVQDVVVGGSLRLLPRIDQTHVLNVFGQLVHLRVVRLLQLLASLVLPHGRRLPLVDEDLGVLGVLLAQPSLLLGLRLEGLVVLKTEFALHCWQP